MHVSYCVLVFYLDIRYPVVFYVCASTDRKFLFHSVHSVVGYLHEQGFSLKRNIQTINKFIL